MLPSPTPAGSAVPRGTTLRRAPGQGMTVTLPKATLTLSNFLTTKPLREGREGRAPPGWRPTQGPAMAGTALQRLGLPTCGPLWSGFRAGQAACFRF